MKREILEYNCKLNTEYRKICDFLASAITEDLKEAEYKIWHGHPVWFLSGNPIVGYSKQKHGIRLMFWSGIDFEENDLNVQGRKFKDASIFYKNISEIHSDNLRRWIRKSKEIQWDYKNIVKRRGELIRIK